jgi:hypothetical protein
MNLDFLLNLLVSFLNSPLADMLFTAAGVLIASKFPAIAKVLQYFADEKLQAVVNRLYEEIKVQWAASGQVIQTADDVKRIIDTIVIQLRRLFPSMSEEKLRGMATTAVMSPKTSAPGAPLIGN